jgi:nucleoside-diphosphate-sugar epimerase
VDGPILVTGGSGFVGANIVLYLAERGHRVVAYDLHAPPASTERFWGPVRDRIEFEPGSVTDAKRLAGIGKRYKLTTIIHAAAVTTVNTISEALLATRVIEVNLLGTVRLLDLARRSHARRFLYVSSAGVYGSTDPDRSVSESAPLQLEGLYAITKEASERLCQRYADLFRLDITIGRLGQPFGPVERQTGARTVLSPIYQMARAALVKKNVRIPGLDYRCDWTYTFDLAQAIHLLIEAEALPNRTYNLSNGQARWLSEAAGYLSLLIPGSRFDWVKDSEDADVDLSSDPRRGPLDISRLRRDVEFEPAYSLEQGIMAALPWWRAMVEAEI